MEAHKFSFLLQGLVLFNYKVKVLCQIWRFLITCIPKPCGNTQRCFQRSEVSTMVRHPCMYILHVSSHLEMLYLFTGLDRAKAQFSNKFLTDQSYFKKTSLSQYVLILNSSNYNYSCTCCLANVLDFCQCWRKRFMVITLQSGMMTSPFLSHFRWDPQELRHL